VFKRLDVILRQAFTRNVTEVEIYALEVSVEILYAKIKDYVYRKMLIVKLPHKLYVNTKYLSYYALQLSKKVSVRFS
jgi:hypothetical protein